MSISNFDKLEDEELDNLFCSKSSYITNFITIFRQDNFSCLVMDYCEVKSFFFIFYERILLLRVLTTKGGDLEKAIKSKKLSHETFDIDTLYLWTKEMILGLDHLHSSDLIHKDLKPR
jgi:serine/threonine protein kinase